MNKTGRKTLKEELKLFERYSELTEPYFRVLKKKLNGEDNTGQMWAVEQLTKAFVKMLPQDMDVTTKGQPINGLSEVEKIKLLALLNESPGSGQSNNRE